MLEKIKMKGGGWWCGIATFTKKLPEEQSDLVWPRRRDVAIFRALELLRRIIACVCTRQASGC